MQNLMIKLAKIQKELKAPKNQFNNFGKYSYRSCEDILEAVKPLLGDAVVLLSDEIVCVGTQPMIPAKLTKEINEFVNRQKITNFQDVDTTVGGERFYIKATATLKSETAEISVTAYAREAEVKKGMDEAQITGSASSYARKYALNGLFLIDDQKDADTQDNTKGNYTHQEPINTPVGNLRALAGLPQGNQDEPPFEAGATIQREQKVRKAGDPCDKCGAELILNPKTNKIFCKDKCWTK